MDFPHLILARFYEHIEPIDRGDRYEDPLQAAPEKTGLEETGLFFFGPDADIRMPRH